MMDTGAFGTLGGEIERRGIGWRFGFGKVLEVKGRKEKVSH